MMTSSSCVDDVLSSIGFGRYQYMLLILCGLGYFAVCSELLVIVFLFSSMSKDFNISTKEFALLPMLSTSSSFIGGVFIGRLSDKIGRQKPFITSVIITAVTGLLSATASSFSVFLFWRSVMSFGLGGISAIDFVLFLESVPTSCRGRYNVYITASGSLGVLAVALTAWGIIPSYGWRYLVAAVALPSVIVAIFRIFITEESPRYLLMKGDVQGASDVLHRIALVNRVTNVHINLQSSVVKESTESWFSLLLQMLATPRMFKLTTLLSVIWFFQFAGYWGLSLYLPSYLKSIGLNQYSTFALMVSAQLPGLLILSKVIDTIGRLRCLRLYATGLTLCTLAITLLSPYSVVVPYTFFCVMIYFCTAPVFALLFTYTPECFPTTSRSTIMGFMNAISSIPGLVVPLLSAELVSLPQKWIYPLVWTSCFAIVSIASYVLEHETKQQSLEVNIL